MAQKNKLPPGIKWRLALTIYGSIGWLIFIIAYLAFTPNSFSLWQNIAIVLISLLILGGIMAGIWIPWKMTYWEDFEEWGRKFEKFGEQTNGKQRSKKR
jgi:hypothetical protein